MAFKFVILICAAAALGAVSAEFDYNPALYNGNNSNNNQNNVNSYNDNVKQPANSYSAPLAALHAFNGNQQPQPQPQQQQQPPADGYNYNQNNYNNNAAQRQTEYQQQQPEYPPHQSNANSYNHNQPEAQQPQQQSAQQPQQNSYNFNNAAAQNQPADAVPTPAGYDYTPQNFAALSSSSSASASASSSVDTFTKLETSFNAQAHHLSAPTAAPSVEEYNPPATYDYSYSVHDDDTGDIKSHAEARNGYFVQGSYSVVDPDGFQRTVSYTVDGPSGFNAVVNRVPYAVRSVPANDLSIPASSAAPVTKLAELPLSNDISLAESSAVSASTTAAAEEKPTDAARIELPVQPRDSYLTPPADARDGKGPYP